MSSILHPTDFSEDSETAFLHALKLTLALRTRLNILHVARRKGSIAWQAFPGVRDTLAKWQLVPEGAGKSVVSSLGIDVSKIVRDADDPVSATTEFMAKHDTDIVVLATQQQGSLPLMGKSVAEPIARKAGNAMTLFVPHGIDGFVNPADGSVKLEKVLIPVAFQPHPAAAISAVERLLAALGVLDGVAVTMLVIDAGDERLAVQLPASGHWEWVYERAAGSVSSAITNFAISQDYDLVAMTTEGINGFMDALRGSTTEQVMREVSCPLLAVPVSRV